MIKSKEELDKITKQFYGKNKIEISKCDGFVEFLKEEDRLKKIIETWNEEQEGLTDFLDILESKGFEWNLRSVRRLVIDKYENIILPGLEFSEVLFKKFSDLRSKINPITAGDMFKCIKDVISSDNTILYQKEKVYISDIDQCITGEDSNPRNFWDTRSSDFYRYFKYCQNTTIPRELVRIKQGDKFKCIREYNTSLFLIEGNIYISRRDDSLFNGESIEVNFKENTLLSEFEKYFIKI